MEYATEEQIKALDRKVDEVLTALKGNDLGTVGVINRLEQCEKNDIKLEQKISTINNNNLKSNSIAATIATAFTLIITYLKSLS